MGEALVRMGYGYTVAGLIMLCVDDWAVDCGKIRLCAIIEFLHDILGAYRLQERVIVFIAVNFLPCL